MSRGGGLLALRISHDLAVSLHVPFLEKLSSPASTFPPQGRSRAEPARWRCSSCSCKTPYQACHTPAALREKHQESVGALQDLVSQPQEEETQLKVVSCENHIDDWLLSLTLLASQECCTTGSLASPAPTVLLRKLLWSLSEHTASGVA